MPSLLSLLVPSLLSLLVPSLLSPSLLSPSQPSPSRLSLPALSALSAPEGLPLLYLLCPLPPLGPGEQSPLEWISQEPNCAPPVAFPREEVVPPDDNSVASPCPKCCRETNT